MTALFCVPLCRSVPRLMGYAHVARGVRLDGKGALKFEERSKDVLGEGREVAEVITVSSSWNCLLVRCRPLHVG